MSTDHPDTHQYIYTIALNNCCVFPYSKTYWVIGTGLKPLKGAQKKATFGRDIIPVHHLNIRQGGVWFLHIPRSLWILTARMDHILYEMPYLEGWTCINSSYFRVRRRFHGSHSIAISSQCCDRRIWCQPWGRDFFFRPSVNPVNRWND
jgi:hypothetical protein